MNRIQYSILCGLLAFVLVSCGKEKEIAVTSVTIGQATAEMFIGETAQLNATVLPSDATDKTVTWASSKQSVATVSSAGLVTALAEGTSTITASAGDKSSTCKVTVSKRIIAVTEVTLNKTSLEITEGEAETLVATVKPDDATDKTVTWTSSDALIAIVDNAGTVTAIKEGSASITATAGEKKVVCAVKVNRKVIPVESVELNKTTLALTKGESETLVATIKPDDTTEKIVVWSTSNESVASVDQTGKVSAVAGGEATISATVGEMTAKCVVTVIVPVTSISLNKESLTLTEGESETLVATVKPDDATDMSVTWSSSDMAVATIDNGKVTALKEGTTIITAKAGEESSTCSVIVTRDTSGDAIVFEDIIAKYACVEKFDSNGDGEVSYAEAAAATSLYGLFTNWNTVKSFDEIKYFTGVTSTAGVFSGLKQLKSIILPDNITSLGDFTGCTSLESAVLPKYIGYMPDHCFENCSALKQVVLPDALNTIPRNCFQYCTSLKSITLPESLTTIGEFAFSQCSELSDIQMPPMLNTVGRYAFEDCVSITSIEFPGSLSKLGEYVMYRCSNLSLLAFSGSNLSSVPVAAFYGCNKLSHIVWPANLNSIGDKAFYGCPLSDANSDNTLTIPQSITTIGTDCFVNTQHIILPSSKLISISQGAFSFGIHLYVPEDLMEMYLQRTNWKEYAPFIYSLPSYPVTPSHEEYIDLGVSVKWAWCDLESSTPGQPGLAYSWYQTDIVPAKTNNIARTPTLSECEELINECEWTAGTYMGRPGVLIVSKKEGQKRNWIFLPAGGATGINIYSERCYYWCLAPKTEEGRYNALYFDPYPPTKKSITHVRSGTVCPVRPVVDKQ